MKRTQECKDYDLGKPAWYIAKRELKSRLDLSDSTLKSYRLEKKYWEEGIHWGYHDEETKKSIWYCWPLIQDWLHNRNDPEAHQRAIESHLASLPSNRKAS